VLPKKTDDGLPSVANDDAERPVFRTIIFGVVMQRRVWHTNGKEVWSQMDGEDKVIECRDCGSEFVFTAGEQSFFSERGFLDPVRCPACRSQRRRERTSNGGDASMGSGGGNRPMFDVICDACGQPTKVPFEPRQGRPVYCRDCFQAQRGSVV
jgi:CxxC-x17-CxxC domain-containing protein